MADILIKGLALPKYCYESDGQVVKPCDFLEVCRREWGVNINALDVHSEACPLVELPPHGELIDKSVLGKMLDERISYCVSEANLSEKEKDLVRWVQSIICGVFSDAPTVVEASR